MGEGEEGEFSAAFDEAVVRGGEAWGGGCAGAGDVDEVERFGGGGVGYGGGEVAGESERVGDCYFVVFSIQKWISSVPSEVGTLFLTLRERKGYGGSRKGKKDSLLRNLCNTHALRPNYTINILQLLKDGIRI